MLTPTPSFSNSLEHKFDWALVDVSFDVDKGVISAGRVFSDCLLPGFIDCFNAELQGPSPTSYDVAGIVELCARVRSRLERMDNEGMAVARDVYLPELQAWLVAEI